MENPMDKGLNIEGLNIKDLSISILGMGNMAKLFCYFHTEIPE
jgi:hypothetical protein